MHPETVFRAQNAELSLSWEESPGPLGCFAPSQFSSQITFGDMENIGHFQRRSLASLARQVLR